MKTHQSLIWLTCLNVIFLFSCSKETVQKSAEGVEAKPATKSSTLKQRPIGGATTFVTFEGGNYISSLGDGITFGNTLPHPINDPTGIYDGYPIPTIVYVNWTLNAAPVPYQINGAYFSIIEPTFPTSGITGEAATLASISAYQTQVNKINTDPTKPLLADRQAAITALAPPVITAVASGGGGVKIVSGLLIQDHNSPTRMSIVNQKYVTPEMAGPKLFVGYTSISPYKFYFYAPVGSTGGAVTSITVTQNGAAILPSAHNLTYSGNENDGFHTIGTVTMGTTVYNINSWLYP